MATAVVVQKPVSNALLPNADITVETFEHGVMDALRNFHSHVQKETLPESQKDLNKMDFATFLKYMASAQSNALLPPPLSDYNLPLSSYYISTSHNTYLTGHQLYGKATVDGYKNVQTMLSCPIMQLTLLIRFYYVAVDVLKLTEGRERVPSLLQTYHRTRLGLASLR